MCKTNINPRNIITPPEIILTLLSHEILACSDGKVYTNYPLKDRPMEAQKSRFTALLQDRWGIMKHNRQNR